MVTRHRPPFPTAFGRMDTLGLKGREAFTAIMARHPQVQLFLCGHLHRTTRADIGGRPALTCPSPAHQVALDIDESAPSCFRMEPPGFMLPSWHDNRLVTHTAAIGDYDGPYPFFDHPGPLNA